MEGRYNHALSHLSVFGERVRPKNIMDHPNIHLQYINNRQLKATSTTKSQKCIKSHNVFYVRCVNKTQQSTTTSTYYESDLSIQQKWGISDFPPDLALSWTAFWCWPGSIKWFFHSNVQLQLKTNGEGRKQSFIHVIASSSWDHKWKIKICRNL